MTEYGYRYDYTKTMMMKMLLSVPDGKGGTKVKIDFETALKLIEKIDVLTLGIPKIIYLVGWQYNGHDDKYPDFFEVNPALKRASDASSYESLLFLMREAEKRHTKVSLHINFSDAYEDAPSFRDYLSADALIRKKNGKPHVIGRYNGKKCYKISLKEAWESGLFQRSADKLLTMFPLEKLGTVHADNFQCYKNFAPDVTIDEMCEYRDKMIRYFRERNIDVTSEFTCREDDSLRNLPFFGLPRDHRSDRAIRILGKFPAVWWLTYLTNRELVEIPPRLLSGGILRNGTKNDPRKGFIYGNMHGEEIFDSFANGNADWEADFADEFATVQMPYLFLTQFKRLSIDGKKNRYVLHCENGVSSHQKGSKIFYGNSLIKDGSTLVLPFPHKKGVYFAYSRNGDRRVWQLPNCTDGTAKIYQTDGIGTSLLYKTVVEDGKLELTVPPKTTLIVECETVRNGQTDGQTE